MYDELASLALEIDAYTLEAHTLEVSSGFTRETTVVALRGPGPDGPCIGRGEDVTYEAPDQHALREAGPTLPLAGRWTLGDFSAHLGTLELWPAAPTRQDSRDYRRWAYESAALDLALRQAGRTLADALGRPPRPLRFVCSTRIDASQGDARLRRYRAASPGLGFKLDPTADWDEALIAALAAHDISVVDLKGAYKGTPVDNPPDPALYRRVADGFPDAWIEDPAVTDATRPVLLPHAARITWDAPIHGVADIEACPWPPRCVNVKPSRFGTLENLLATYAYCERHGIAMYGGGQFEQSVGRDQIQLLAALFHADGPNDVAPRAFNDPEPPPTLPTSPLTLPEAPGFGVA